VVEANASAINEYYNKNLDMQRLIIDTLTVRIFSFSDRNFY